MGARRSSATVGEVPLWIKDKLRLFKKISKFEQMDRNGRGGVPSKLRQKEKECMNDAGLKIVKYPEVPDGLRAQEAEEIKELARKTVKKGYRKRPEDYPIPREIRKDAVKRKYYMDCIRTELAFREGYK